MKFLFTLTISLLLCNFTYAQENIRTILQKSCHNYFNKLYKPKLSGLIIVSSI